jgi:hypothetical protein
MNCSFITAIFLIMCRCFSDNFSMYLNYMTILISNTKLCLRWYFSVLLLIFQSSFVGRGSNQFVPSSKKHGTSKVRSSFIFGRDDSNSRPSLLISEDSSDTVMIIRTYKTGIECLTVHLCNTNFL